MTASQLRAEARNKLANKWGKAAIQTLIFAVIEYIISFVLGLIPGIGSIISLVISVPLSYGFLISIIKLRNDEDFGYLDFLNNGFSNFSKAWSVTLNTLLKLIIPLVILIVCIFIFSAGIASSSKFLAFIGIVAYIAAIIYFVVKAISYALSLYILYDNPEITGKEAVEKSAELMNGKVWAYICLNLSFIGWAILSSFTFGIGMLWLLPYMYIAKINFYKNLLGDSEPVVVSEENNDEV